jgi:hypothetical protein
VVKRQEAWKGESAIRRFYRQQAAARAGAARDWELEEGETVGAGWSDGEEGVETEVEELEEQEYEEEVEGEEEDEYVYDDEEEGGDGMDWEGEGGGAGGGAGGVLVEIAL